MLQIIGQTTTTATTFVGPDRTPMVVDQQPYSAAGAAVFFVIVAILAGGALVLYLRNRPKSVNRN